MKQIGSHLGGLRNGMVVSWPGHIKDVGGGRSQFSHVIDIAPTIYEAVGITPPKSVYGAEQAPIAGTSLLYSLNDAKAAESHTTQYFEMFGNRAIYRDGWMATARHGLPPLSKDYSQGKDLAAQKPQRLAALKALFDKEARSNQVYPLNDRWIECGWTNHDHR